MIDKKLSKYFSRLGRKGVKARMKKLTAEQRQEIARNAVNARWAKAKNRKKAKGKVGTKP